MAGDTVARGNVKQHWYAKFSVCVFTLIPNKHLIWCTQSKTDYFVVCFMSPHCADQRKTTSFV